ncbi:MAG: helix-turn-helix transcriptional regulator [Spirochaetia bacterium]|nr:helix-turn-helix transcriptional regulator [Spirochaetia bacterium]
MGRLQTPWAWADAFEGQLTPAELSVAGAAVSGLSDREIAKQRGSAARTVAVQLRSIYGKLGISSRTELAAVFDGGLCP